jgi:SAM-dependent methyltransferase
LAEGASSRQRDHYNEIHGAYDAHYGDSTSLEYRRRFFLDPLLSNMDLNGLDVADLAAGSGYTSTELMRRYPGVRPVGFDISDEACAAYRSRTGQRAFAVDLTKGDVPSPSFDVAVVVGGLHHCVADIGGALRRIAGMIRPGGALVMAEPNRECWLEPLRRMWYRRDGYFEASTERALSHDELLKAGSDWFRCENVLYKGGPAYFLIYNSLVLRVPRHLKPTLAKPLFLFEDLFDLLPGRGWFPYFLARWRRL